ncbi:MULTISPECIES: DUF4189 domain-containing protein [Acinetobacter]|jgi:hypothetical protein|uniref:DUF4189 domain-containing protein n=3 Tax=Acinetobacter bereziniae TaxID=106648 RepID=A0A8I1AJY6_ACIBZ|nr:MULTISPECIES: DUF4189 domain-containing protein [Acinetobacter]MEC8125808.1 DUF4189 domain-containing protein [Pseudomonadota bacterium]MBI0395825.1 DUF4189 domain-containing protein [Acinetobacter bereziniae]MBJ8423781.1 DUF4189 domain-containing protein [Acinetobacter bereziniae]MBJ8446036.1 DUF4189 domain-containing protein [Acinetobacter bereziniae]MBJ9372284.1 DUF4189 domain-containing protein [Acinetobacter sp. TGL-Y2]
MNKKRFVLAFLTAFVSLFTFAQNCPQGIPQGTPSCVPPDQLGYSTAPPVNTAYWKKTWGAMAESPFAIGTSTGHFSRRSASKEAMDKCKSRGGNECKITFTYKNQCAVMAKPINEDGLVRVTYQSAATLKEASRLVLPYCAENNNGKTCEVFYSNCTEPVLIR